MRQNLCERARGVKRAAFCLVPVRDAHRVFLGFALAMPKSWPKLQSSVPRDIICPNSCKIPAEFFAVFNIFTSASHKLL